MKLASNATLIIVPDSYKGTLPAPDVAQAIRAGFQATFADAHFKVFPLADGGEGSSSLIAEIVGAERVTRVVCGPESAPVDGFYFLSADRSRAFVELAAASGYALSRDAKRTARVATTYGTGELIRHAIESGVNEVVLFLGGSATTDGGVGIAKALGYRFYDSAGRILETGPGGERLAEIARIECDRGLDEMLSRVRFVAVADVANPLYGERGAAHVYGPQKGLDEAGVRELDQGLRNLAEVTARDLGRDLSQTRGGGAAGGAGFAVLAFLRGTLRPGAQYFLDLIDFDRHAADASLIITGEGKVDAQSIEGKLLNELLLRTERLGKPLLSLSGVVDLSPERLAEHPQFHVFGLGRMDALERPGAALEFLAAQVARLMA